MEAIRIVIVDDHPVYREGLRSMLESEAGIQVEGEVSDGLQAIDLAKDLRPHVMLLDINIPSMNGLQVAREMRSAVPDTAVILMTGYHDEEQLIHALRAGASAYFDKQVTPKRLLSAIRHVHSGFTVIGDDALSEQEAQVWLEAQLEERAVAGIPEEEQFSPLSPREMEILQHAARGQSNKEIARALGISQQTVKNHISSILRKLPARDRTEAAVYALRHGWIRLQDTRPDAGTSGEAT